MASKYPYPACIKKAGRIKRLRMLVELAQDVAYDAEHTPIKPMKDDQEKALYRVLRLLDIRNDYKEGDALRKAFGVELDTVRSRRGK